jgi:hypothetical protein
VEVQLFIPVSRLSRLGHTSFPFNIHSYNSLCCRSFRGQIRICNHHFQVPLLFTPTLIYLRVGLILILVKKKLLNLCSLVLDFSTINDSFKNSFLSLCQRVGSQLGSNHHYPFHNNKTTVGILAGLECSIIFDQDCKTYSSRFVYSKLDNSVSSATTVSSRVLK